MRGADFTWDFVNYHGLFAPLILDDTVGSGLRVPAPSTSVTDIANTLGESFPVEVIEVATQVRAAAAAIIAFACFVGGAHGSGGRLTPLCGRVSCPRPGHPPRLVPRRLGGLFR